ncbi:MAG: stealth conserved region 3 domain-containing protein [Acidobacteriota bacterium]
MTTGGTEERIDAVYSWVDGEDPSFLADCRRWIGPAQEPDAIAARRFRDNGELRYSLRSIERHAPWIDGIHFVTNGRMPEWLNTSHPRVSVVDHRQVFPDPAVLPVFNSCAIELNLHRIPGLSRRFLYLNDDLFLGRDLSRGDYLVGDCAFRYYFEPNPLPMRSGTGPVHDRAYAYTSAVLNRLSKGRRVETNRAAYVVPRRYKLAPPSVRRLLPPRRLLPAHVPQLYDRCVLEELERWLPVEFAATRAHRFRAADDLVLRILYAFYLLECEPAGCRLEPVLLDWESSDYQFISLQVSPEGVEGAFARMASLNPRFLCVNDDLGDVFPDDPVLALWRRVLQARYPAPSSFENVKSAGASLSANASGA